MFLPLLFTLLSCLEVVYLRQDNCYLETNKASYNLKRLSGRNWIIKSEKFPTKACLSFCNKLDVDQCEFCKSSNKKDLFACVQNTQNNSVINAGTKTTGPTLDKTTGLLHLTYTDGEQCMEKGEVSSYTTKIFFMCPESWEESKSEPEYIGKYGNCVFEFLWSTEEACPVQISSASVGQKCVIKYPGMNYEVSLLSLRKENYYTVQGQGQVYQVNICDDVHNGACEVGQAACEVEGMTLQQKRGLGKTSTGTLSWDGDKLRMEYSEDGSKLVIDFECDRSAKEDKLEFNYKTNDGEIHLKMSTPLACLPLKHDCVLTNSNGEKIDLGRLGKSSGNWKISDQRKGHDDLVYYINVCRTINDGSLLGEQCADGPMSACGISSRTKENWSLGYMHTPPVLNSDRTIKLTYRGGTMCHGKFSRSTEIEFICHESEMDPEFLDETPECSYLFVWYTPAACPIKSEVGKSCSVTDPVYGYFYDMTPLKENDPYRLTIGSSQYDISICSSIRCRGKDNVGVCLTENNKQTILGMATSSLVFNDGTLEMTMEDGDVDGDCDHRSVSIVFSCHENEGGQPHLITQGCTTFISFPSKHACPPVNKIECSARGPDGSVYDLSPLTLNHFNYEVPSRTKGISYLINICRSVYHSKGAQCPFSSGVCKVNDNEDEVTKKFTSVGDVTSEPVFENGTLQLRYKSGGLCLNAASDKTHMETVIWFQCEKEKPSNKPQLVSESSCEYKFVWPTDYACPESHREELTSTCKVKDSETNYVYDLSPLSKILGYKVKDNAGHEYVLNVCDGISSSVCGDDVGACQIDSKTNKKFKAGAPNANLHLHGNNVLFLNYSGGDPCHDGKYSRNTVITFICDLHGNGQGPVFITETSDCTYMFNWYTELACQRKVTCMVESADRVIDLTPLVYDEGNFVIRDGLDSHPSKEYFINICRPLVEVPGLDCAPGSAACFANSYGSSDFRDELSLGRAMTPPVYTPEGVHLLYTGGSPCPDRPALNVTSRIVFQCQRGIKAEMKYTGRTHDCQYLFEMKSEILCTDQSVLVEEAKKDCKFQDRNTNITYDLSLLQRKYDTYWVNRASVGYSLNVCYKAAGCGNEAAAACKIEGDKKTVYGRVDEANFIYDMDNIFKLTYKKGDECPTKEKSKSFHTTEIWFECDPDSSPGKPTFYGEFGCTLIFKWKTDLVCSDEFIISTVIDDKKVSTPSSSSSSSALIGIFVAIIIIAVLAGLLWKRERREVLINTARSALYRARARAFYTKVDAGNSEASGLLSAEVGSLRRAADEDDDELLRI